LSVVSDGREAFGEVSAEIADRPATEKTLGLLMRDLMATLGWSADGSWKFILETATGSLEFIDDEEWPFEQRVLENTQQRMHDEFVDSAWPQCPLHGTHPLWLADNRPWRWQCADVSIPIGELNRFERGSQTSGTDD